MIPQRSSLKTASSEEPVSEFLHNSLTRDTSKHSDRKFNIRKFAKQVDRGIKTTKMKA